MPKTEYRFYLTNGKHVMGTNASEVIPILRDLEGYRECSRAEYVEYKTKDKSGGLFKKGEPK
jgi:hypothetical protein